MAKKSAKVSQEFGSSEAEECGRIVAQAWQKCGASVAEVQGKRGRSVVQAWQKERGLVHFFHRNGVDIMEEKLSKNILKTDIFFHLLIYYHQNHLCLANNISNSSTPGFKAMKIQDHLHSTDFINESLQQKTSTLLQKKL